MLGFTIPAFARVAIGWIFEGGGAMGSGDGETRDGEDEIVES